MNIDSGFFYTLLEGRDPKYLSMVERDWFEGPWGPIYDFVTECLTDPDIKQMPASETISSRFSVEFFDTSEPVGFFVSELRKRRARIELELGIQTTVMPLISQETPQQNKPFEASRKMMELCADIGRKYSPVTGGESMDFFKDIDFCWEEYERSKAKKGLLGIPFPFDPMNMATGGLIPGELTFVMSEYGRGKTWFLLLCARTALKVGKSVLLISQEMGPKRVAMRLFSLMCEVSPDKLRRGMMSVEEENHVKEMRDEFKQIIDRRLFIHGPKDVRSIADYEALLSVRRPQVDLVLWDSPYLAIRSRTWEERTDFIRDLKQSTETYGIPALATWQLTHEGKAALTVATATDSDHCFRFFRDENLRESSQAKMSSLKTRDGLELEEMMLVWDILNCEFDVISYNIPGVGSSDGIGMCEFQSPVEPGE